MQALTTHWQHPGADPGQGGIGSELSRSEHQQPRPDPKPPWRGVATQHRDPTGPHLAASGPFETLSPSASVFSPDLLSARSLFSHTAIVDVLTTFNFYIFPFLLWPYVACIFNFVASY